MGTTVHDFLHPEIILFGVDDPIALEKAKTFYRTITDAPFRNVVNAVSKGLEYMII